MARETRPKDYPKLKNYKPTRFMLPTSHYDKAKADRAVTFIENLCHTKGKWSGTRFWLLPWQEQLIRDIFGIVKADGNRQFRTAFVEICKKVGKSELAAAIALYLLYADNEPSAEVYGAAADRQQASIVFDVARQMVEMSPALMKRSKLMSATKRIVNYGNAGFYQVLSAEVGSFQFRDLCSMKFIHSRIVSCMTYLQNTVLMRDRIRFTSLLPRLVMTGIR
jgi:phage terminase large subunit-like protein